MSFENHPEAKAKFTFATPVTTAPGATVIASDFQTWPAALFNFNSPLNWMTDNGVGNSYSAKWDRTTLGAGSASVGVVSGLITGRSYTLTLQVKALSGTPTFALNIGTPTGTPTATSTTYAARSVTFTAASVSAAIWFQAGAAGAFHIDNVSLDLLPVIATEADLPISSGDLSLDKSRVPFGSAQVTVPLMSEELLERLDPYSNQRVLLTASANGAWSMTDPVYSAWTTQRRNRFHNPRANSQSRFSNAGTAATLSNITDFPGDVNTAVRVTRTATTNTRWLDLTTLQEVSANTLVRLTAAVRSSVEMTGQTFSYRPAGASSTTGQVTLTNQVIPAGESTLVMEFTTSSTASATTAAFSITGAGTVGATFDITKIIVETGPTFGSWFDGAVTSSNPLEGWTWVGSPGVSASMYQTRTVTTSPQPLWTPSDTRTFNFGLTSREVSHDGREVALSLATDEAILQRYAPLTDDLGAFDLQNSLRSIVNYALNRAIPGAALQAGGAADRPFRVLADSTNLITDPRYTRTTGGGYGQGNISTAVDNSWLGSEVVAGIHMYAPANADGYIDLNNAGSGMAFGMQVGRTYTFSATGSVRSVMGGSVGSYARRLVAVAFVNGIGYQNIAYSPQVPNVAETGASPGTRVSVTFTVPPNTTQMWVRAFHGQTTGTITWRSFRLSEAHTYPGPHNFDYFDGMRGTTAEYSHSWTGAADISASRRIALINRSPDLLAWKAGTTAWSFLETLKNAAGLRLFCDETAPLVAG